MLLFCSVYELRRLFHAQWDGRDSVTGEDWSCQSFFYATQTLLTLCTVDKHRTFVCHKFPLGPLEPNLQTDGNRLHLSTMALLYSLAT